MMKKTLLQIVQDILSDMDSEDVNTLSDSVEAQQVASVVEKVFYQLIATRKVPEHKELIKLTALSDSSFPTHFYYPDNVKEISWVSYDTSDDGSFDYEEVFWVEPEEFLRRTDGIASNYDSVSDKNSGTKLRIKNNKQPTFYTSFDDYYIVFDAYDSSVGNTLQESKVRAYGTKYPVFTKNDDDYIPDIDEVYFPLMIAESTSMCQSLLKGGSDPKVEQSARRQKAYIQNDKYKTVRGNILNDYGRH